MWDVEVPTFFRQWAHKWRWSCRTYVPSDLYPQEDSWYSFLSSAAFHLGSLKYFDRISNYVYVNSITNHRIWDPSKEFCLGVNVGKTNRIPVTPLKYRRHNHLKCCQTSYIWKGQYKWNVYHIKETSQLKISSLRFFYVRRISYCKNL
jgi:hypothetical protein